MRPLPRPARLAVALACSAAVFLSLPGCSFALVKRYRPPPDADATPSEAPQCTSSRTAPVVDTVLGAALLGAAAAALIDSQGNCQGWDCMGKGLAMGAAVVTGVPGLVFTGSAWYGYAKTGTCAAAKRDFASRNAVSDACDPGDPACVRVAWPPPRSSATAAAGSPSPAWEAEGLR